MARILAGRARIFNDFSSILDYAAYEPLPNDWLIGITDVVDSASAVRRGAYHDVNFAGASVIAAIGNACGSYDFPFTFGGDGASFALPADHLANATAVLQQVMAFAQSDLNLTLRAGLLSVHEIRANQRDVRIARYAASEHATYSMFAGGGLRWAEREVKRGRYAVERVNTVSKPDLTGLSCDWLPIPNEHGIILSLLVEPCGNAGSAVFSDLAKRVLAVFDTDSRRGHPVPKDGPAPKRRETYVDHESRSEIALNSDFRKYDDLLRLTLDCSNDQADAVEAILQDAAGRGEVRYGMHRQSHALMTCLVPAENSRSHLHFLDGMDGGYAKAAQMMKTTACQMRSQSRAHPTARAVVNADG